MLYLANLFKFSLDIVVSQMNVLIIIHIGFQEITKIIHTAGIYLVSLICKCKLHILEGKDNKLPLRLFEQCC